MIPARRPFLRDNLFYVLSCSVFFVFSYTDGRIQVIYKNEQIWDY